MAEAMDCSPSSSGTRLVTLAWWPTPSTVQWKRDLPTPPRMSDFSACACLGPEEE